MTAAFVSCAIREARDSDIESMADLWVESWQETLPEFDFHARRSWLVGRIETSPRAIVAEGQDARIRGFALFDNLSGWLDQIAVDVEFFGTDTGRTLLAEVKSACPTGVHLDVNLANPRAMAFYRREGFLETGGGFNKASGLRTVSMLWKPPAEFPF